jgi:catechol 2,3-dioxygenase-like lactoylglutathione lyase family enzyme
VPALTRIAPEIPASDLPDAVAWYEQKLGFRLAMEMPDRTYAIVERDDVAIHLFANFDGKSPVGVHVFVQDLDGLYAEFEAREAAISQAILRKPWGNRDFRVIDPSGNELKFTEPLRS